MYIKITNKENIKIVVAEDKKLVDTLNAHQSSKTLTETLKKELIDNFYKFAEQFAETFVKVTEDRKFEYKTITRENKFKKVTLTYILTNCGADEADVLYISEKGDLRLCKESLKTLRIVNKLHKINKYNVCTEEYRMMNTFIQYEYETLFTNNYKKYKKIEKHELNEQYEKYTKIVNNKITEEIYCDKDGNDVTDLYSIANKLAGIL